LGRNVLIVYVYYQPKVMSTSTIFFTQKHNNIPFPLEKGIFEGLAGVALSRGRDIPGHSKKNTILNIVLFPPLNYSPSLLAVLLVVLLVVVLLSCCCHVVVVVFIYFVAALQTLPSPPQLACHCHRHRRWSGRRMMPATQTPTAVPPRWRKLSAGHWNPAHCWTGPSRLVTWAAKVATMMAARAVAAEVGSRTGSVWSSPPPPEAA
jgi:hypothetical protein